MDYFAAMQAFVRTVDLGSFSKAAAEAGVKVSTVSRYVSGLEADLGAALLNRSTRSLHLTEAGRTFYARARQVLLGVEEARDATRSLNARPQGLLRLALPNAFGRRHVMPHMGAFLDAYPDIRLDAALSDTMVDLIETGIDVAVRIGALVDSTLVAKRLAPQKSVLAASPRYLASSPGLDRPGDLARHRCLLSSLHPLDLWHAVSRAEPGGSAEEIPVGATLRTNDLEVVRDAALGGLGVALLPTWLCHDALRSGTLTAVLPGWKWLPSLGSDRAIWGVYPPKKIVSPKVKAFLAFLSARFGRQPYWDRGDDLPPITDCGARRHRRSDSGHLA